MHRRRTARPVARRTVLPMFHRMLRPRASLAFMVVCLSCGCEATLGEAQAPAAVPSAPTARDDARMLAAPWMRPLFERRAPLEAELALLGHALEEQPGADA